MEYPGLEIFILVTSGIIITTVTGFASWIKSKIGCFQKIDARSLRQSRALIQLAMATDEITQRLHPEQTNLNSTKTIKNILEDEYGNL